MRSEGKLDYLEMQAGGGAIDSMKAFYSAAFGWSFVDLWRVLFRIRGGSRWRLRRFGAEGHEAAAGALFGEPGRTRPKRSRRLGAGSSGRSFDFPGGRRFHFVDPAGKRAGRVGRVGTCPGASPLGRPVRASRAARPRKKTAPQCRPASGLMPVRAIPG